MPGVHAHSGCKVHAAHSCSSCSVCELVPDFKLLLADLSPFIGVSHHTQSLRGQSMAAISALIPDKILPQVLC